MINFLTGAQRAPVRKNSPLLPAAAPMARSARGKRAVLWFLCLALAAALSAPVAAPLSAAETRLFGGPVLKIIYAAESRGQLHPCLQCGKNSSGGLARRAGFIERERQDGVPALVVIGPGEFWADEARKPVSPGELERSLVRPEDFLRAYDRFSAQGVYLSPRAQKWLGKLSADLPPNYIKMQSRPLSRVIPLDGRSVGLVFFPQADGKRPNEIAAAYAEALEAGRALRREVDLLVGVSPWGIDAERPFAEKAQGLYHVLLGGGSGFGFDSVVVGEAGGVIWVRPEDQGRTVNRIEILAWPEGAAPHWEPEANFRADMLPLGPSVPSDPEIARIFPQP